MLVVKTGCDTKTKVKVKKVKSQPQRRFSSFSHPTCKYRQAYGITTLHKAGTIAQANRQGRSGYMLIFLDLARAASWILGTSVPLKKGPSARGLQTVPHSKTGTRGFLGPCAPAFRRCAFRRRRSSRRRCCYTLSAACTRSALVRS